MDYPQPSPLLLLTPPPISALRTAREVPPTPSPQRPALLFVPCSQRTRCNQCCWGLGCPPLWVPGTRARERRVVRCGHQGTRVKTKRPEAKRQDVERGCWAGGVTVHTLHNQQEGLGGERGGGRRGRSEDGSRPEQLREATGGWGAGPELCAHPIPKAQPSPRSPRALAVPAFPTAGRLTGTASHPQPPRREQWGRKEWQGAPAPLRS